MIWLGPLQEPKSDMQNVDACFLDPRVAFREEACGFAFQFLLRQEDLEKCIGVLLFFIVRRWQFIGRIDAVISRMLQKINLRGSHPRGKPECHPDAVP